MIRNEAVAGLEASPGLSSRTSTRSQEWRSERGSSRFERQIAGIVGPYRYQNFGDDLIGLVLAGHLARLGFKEVWMHGISEANAEVVGAVVRPRNQVIWRPEFVVIGGGHILGDGSYTPSAYYQRLAFWTALTRWCFRRRTEICGVGAGPLALRRSRIYAALACRFVQKVGVRDPESTHFVTRSLKCRGSKVLEGADLALLWPKMLPARVYPPEDRFAVGVQMDWPASRPVKLPSVPHSLISPLGNRYLFLSNSRRGTRARSVVSVEGPAVNYTRMPDFLQELSRCRVLITTHLHLAVAAYAARIPTFTLAVNPKTRRFYEQIGHPERCIDVSESGHDWTEALLELLRRIPHDSTWTPQDDRRLTVLQNAAGLMAEQIAT